jgi:hypothetical protein
MMHEVEEYCWQSGIEGSIYTKGGGVRDTWGGGFGGRGNFVGHSQSRICKGGTFNSELPLGKWIVR